jgi:hypothetical protein
MQRAVKPEHEAWLPWIQQAATICSDYVTLMIRFFDDNGRPEAGTFDAAVDMAGRAPKLAARMAACRHCWRTGLPLQTSGTSHPHSNAPRLRISPMRHPGLAACTVGFSSRCPVRAMPSGRIISLSFLDRTHGLVAFRPVFC